MIPVTYRASFSYLLRHPWQLVLSLLGIVIGVAVIVAVGNISIPVSVLAGIVR